MPQDRQTGTAWVLSLDDYAYTFGLGPMGWAWEFLRRDANYQCDYRINRAGHPVPIEHNSGAVILRLRRRVFAAERWGLHCFADPRKSAHDAPVFWLVDQVKHSVSCTLRVANDNELGVLSLASFAGQRRVLVTPDSEQVVIASNRLAARVVVRNSSFLIGASAVTFEIIGLDQPIRAFEAINNLRSLRSDRCPECSVPSEHHSKYFDYLVALDAHLAGHSFRDIAEILYGSDRIRPHWTDDSRGYKSKVRRAVERGLALMNGGYRELL
jgi:Uncharacterized conserved protein (DUF2285)/Family of unknown function (DUF6499)